MRRRQSVFSAYPRITSIRDRTISRRLHRGADRLVGGHRGAPEPGVGIALGRAHELQQVHRRRTALPRQPRGGDHLADRPRLLPVEYVERGAHRVGTRAARREEPLQVQVVAVVVQLHRGRVAVAARPSDLLVAGVQRRGCGGVQHEPHVGLVDPRPERRRGDDDVEAAVHDAVVHLVATAPPEACVTGRGGHTAGGSPSASRMLSRRVAQWTSPHPDRSTARSTTRRLRRSASRAGAPRDAAPGPGRTVRLRAADRPQPHGRRPAPGQP
ncbi:MAG: hypothetical protein ABT15_06230 [Pseudonocardia sp. SCN 73-27]|nr:MAG: hypothetical protein ABS80_16410 [Pseudonocardia sp. SCN 72-51]ODV07683.1 MAG: hypothetical protein ABT15_06230 [Pseudonocardia sp. SCN 73-27]